jgi:hypothetical protein
MKSYDTDVIFMTPLFKREGGIMARLLLSIIVILNRV